RFGELLDRVTAVFQDAGFTVDIGDRAAARGGIGESRIVDSQARTLAVADLLKVGGADSAVGNRQLILFAGAIVRDGQRLIIGHVGSPVTIERFALHSWCGLIPT